MESINFIYSNSSEGHPFLIAMKLYDQVAERSGFLVYRKSI